MPKSRKEQKKEEDARGYCGLYGEKKEGKKK
jgi:hypothetical protein